MTNFTLSTALHYIKKNLLITFLLFVTVFYIFSTWPILDNRYQMSKTISVASYPPLYEINILNKDSIEMILSSKELRNILANSHGLDETVIYKVDPHKSKNTSMVVLSFKGTSIDSIINASNAIMIELKKINEPLLNEKIELTKKEISIKNALFQSIRLLSNNQALSDEDIKQYAEYQKIYDETYKQDIIYNTSASTLSVSRFKREKVAAEIQNKQSISSLTQEINELESFLKDFKEISYLLPTTSGSVSKYYPNVLVFIGISLFVAVFYNLIMLNYYFRKHNK